ncbi:copper resistance CopD superfamily protein (plasmid) [Rhizobium sp. N6212]|nr:copper resistance CopD superfamily protein [Rhizobium sp. N6212]ANK99903.1 copper resistance CopD superfamily protein [Rhizobium sp. N621]ANL06033.1 copper resistance CopD superfamily protein [Rhizobium esperanzae]ANL12198.1 copper resistance CopD superfamily protein [Rhizobium sp. N1341]ANM36872.1 copper resistance CopD superfamily protein [Rhizobium sp. N871]ANM43043.1 copper resistance CopD superfamily protein [Rhizobium sp. N741]
MWPLRMGNLATRLLRAVQLFMEARNRSNLLDLRNSRQKRFALCLGKPASHFSWNCSRPACAAAVIVMGTCLPTGALAHATLKNSTPAANETLDRPPTAVELHFNEPVRLIRATANDGSGPSQELAAETSGADVRLRFANSNVRGTVIVSYRVESEDGHPVGGALAFNIGAPSTGLPVALGERTDPSLPIAIWLVHTATVLFMAFIVGGALFDRWLGAGRGRAAGVAAVLLPGAALLAAGLYLQGLDEAGRGLVLAGGEPFEIALQGNAAICAGLFFLSLMVTTLPFGDRKIAGRILAAVALALAAGAFAFSGHCSIVEPRWIGRTAIFLHSATLLFWIGSLPPLWRLCRMPLELRPLESFSRSIPLAFAATIVAGTVLAVAELPALAQILSSLYGRILVVKIMLVAVLCMLAAYNRFWLTGATLAGDAVARRRLRRSIAFEIVLAVAIIGAAGLWRFAGPGQADAADVTPIASVHLHADSAMAQLELEAEPNGTGKIHVAVMAPDFGALDPRQVVLRLKKPDSEIEPMKFELARAAQGGWETSGLPVRDPKSWLADLEVLIDDFHSVHLEGSLSE